MTQEQQKLVEDNHNLIYHFLRKYKLEHDKWYDMAAIGLCKAAISYDESISKFSTYAYKVMLNTVFKEKNKEFKLSAIPKHKLSYYDEEYTYKNDEYITFFDTLHSCDNTESQAIFNIRLHNFMNNITEKERQVLHLTIKGYLQREIGEIMGYSQTHIGRITNRMLNKID